MKLEDLHVGDWVRTVIGHAGVVEELEPNPRETVVWVKRIHDRAMQIGTTCQMPSYKCPSDGSPLRWTGGKNNRLYCSQCKFHWLPARNGRLRKAQRDWTPAQQELRSDPKLHDFELRTGDSSCNACREPKEEHI